jgi:hypothetical protein
VNECTGLSGNGAGASDISIYPNPVNDFLHIELPQYPVEISLINGLSQMVYTNHLSGNSHSIDMRSLAKGVYHLVVASETIVRTFKVIVAE